MNARRSVVLALGGVLLLGAVSGAPRAAVICLTDSCSVLFPLGTTEEPDPLGLWELIRDLEFPYPIDPASPWGVPDIAVAPATGWPVVIWSIDRRTDRDLAFSEWTGAGWRPMEVVFSGLDDDREPDIAVAADGTVHVVWWQANRQRAVSVTRPAGRTTWGAPVVVALNARRPSVVTPTGEVLIAFERPLAFGQQVVARSQKTGAAPQETVVASTSRTAALDVRLHAGAGRIWIDWKHDSAWFGYAERVTGRWTTLTVVHGPIRRGLAKKKRAVRSARS